MIRDNKIITTLLLALLILGGCKKKNGKNTVNIQNINPDKSFNYYYLFKDQIEKERIEDKNKKNQAFDD